MTFHCHKLWNTLICAATVDIYKMFVSKRGLLKNENIENDLLAGSYKLLCPLYHLNIVAKALSNVHIIKPSMRFFYYQTIYK